MTAKEILQLLLDQIDYARSACRSTEMIGAVLPHEVLAQAREIAHGEPVETPDLPPSHPFPPSFNERAAKNWHQAGPLDRIACYAISRASGPPSWHKRRSLASCCLGPQVNLRSR